MARPFSSAGQQQESPAPQPFQAASREGLPTPISSEAAPAGSRHESLLDANATFEGTFKAEQDVRIQGNVSGEIFCKGLLTIDTTATVRARIEAHDVAINGTLDGEIVCTGQFRLGSTAVVRAGVKAGSIVVEEGASLQGMVEANVPTDNRGRAAR